jgi:hypothetical protein
MSAGRKVPEGLKAGGRRLWKAIDDDYELDEHELALLLQAARTVDALDLLQAAVDAEGPLVSSPQGPRAHPGLVEARQQRIALARLLAALRVPWGEEGDEQKGARPQRRVGVRGTYGLRSVH